MAPASLTASAEFRTGLWNDHPAFSTRAPLECWSDLKDSSVPPTPPTAMHVAHSPSASVTSTKRKTIDDPQVKQEARVHGTGRTKRHRQDRNDYYNNGSGSGFDDVVGAPPNAKRTDDGMDWETEPAESNAEADLEDLVSSSSESLRFDLIRDAEPPTITPHHSSFFSSGEARDLPPSQAIPMHLEVLPDAYKLIVPLPGYTTEQITLSCKKGRVLIVVADRWELQRHCRHEWTVSFDDDVLMHSIVASMKSGGILEIGATRFRTTVPIEYKVPRRLPVPYV